MEMKEAISSEKLTSNHQTTRCYFPEDCTLDTPCCENLKHHLGLFSLFFHSQNTILPTLVTAEYVKPSSSRNPIF